MIVSMKDSRLIVEHDCGHPVGSFPIDMLRLIPADHGSIEDIRERWEATAMLIPRIQDSPHAQIITGQHEAIGILLSVVDSEKLERAHLNESLSEAHKTISELQNFEAQHGH